MKEISVKGQKRTARHWKEGFKGTPQGGYGSL